MLIPARLKLITAITVSVFAALAFMGGCNGSGLSSGQRYSIAVDTYSASVRAMVTASQLEAIDVKDYLAWEENARKPASALLDQWAASIAAGRPFTAFDAIDALLERMVADRVSAERKAKATGPPKPLGSRSDFWHDLSTGSVVSSIRTRFTPATP